MSEPGHSEVVCDGVIRVPLRSRTPPPFTHTNAYVLASEGVGVLVDPGGGEAGAADAVAEALAALSVREPKGILLTHTHRDHVGGLEAMLARWPGVQVWAPAGELDRCEPSWRALGVRHGRRLTLGSAALTLVGTPGHSLDHVAPWWPERRLLVAGDLVAGEGSMWVGLPDGDVSTYLASLERAAALDPAIVAPAHGPVRRDGKTVLTSARDHRLQREATVLEALARGPADLENLRERVYPGIPPEAHDLAERSLLAHLAKLLREFRVMHVGEGAAGPYARV